MADSLISVMYCAGLGSCNETLREEYPQERLGTYNGDPTDEHCALCDDGKVVEPFSFLSVSFLGPGDAFNGGLQWVQQHLKALLIWLPARRSLEQ